MLEAGFKARLFFMRKTGQLRISSDINAQQKLLRQNIHTYQNPLRAAIRETLANAIDACEEVGGTEPVRIYTDESQKTIYIEDKGPGMSEEFILEQFLAMSTTTKDGKGQGSMGIGGKSPWAYTSVFYMSSTCEGRTVSATFTDVETEYLVDIEEVPNSGRPSGVTVSIPIQEDDWQRAVHLCKMYATLCTYPVLLNNESLYEEPAIKYEDEKYKWWAIRSYKGLYLFNRHIPVWADTPDNFLGGVCLDFSVKPMTPYRDRFIGAENIDTNLIQEQGLELLQEKKEELNPEEYLRLLQKIVVCRKYWERGFLFTDRLSDSTFCRHAAAVSPHFSILPTEKGNIFVNSARNNYILTQRCTARNGRVSYQRLSGKPKNSDYGYKDFTHQLIPNDSSSYIYATNLPYSTAIKRARSLLTGPNYLLVLEGAEDSVMKDIYQWIPELPEPPKKEKGARKGTATPRDKVKDVDGKVYEKKDIDFYLTKSQRFGFSISKAFPNLTFITLSSPVKGVQSFQEYLLSHPDKLKTVFQKGVVKRFLENLPELIMVGEDSVVLSQEMRRVEKDQSYNGCARLISELHYDCIKQGKTLFSTPTATDIPILDKDVKREYNDTRIKVRRFLKYLGYEEDSIPQLEAMPWPQRPHIFDDIDFLRASTKTFRDDYDKLRKALEIEETEDDAQQPN